MSKFKIGDRVIRVVKPHPAGIMQIGDKGVVSGFTGAGHRVVLDNNDSYSHDPECLELIVENGPIRTRTVTEIVSGRYGLVEVGHVDGKEVNLSFSSYFSAAELTAAISTLTAIRDALEGGAS